MPAQFIKKPNKFVGLHAHTGFSTFDGMGLPQEHFNFVIENSKEELEIPALAITEHGHCNSYAHAYLYAKDLIKAGKKFKFLPGCEFYIHPDLAQWKKDKIIAENSVEDEQHGSTVENEEESKSAKFYDPIKRRHHLVVIAKHSKGLESLFATVSKGFIDGFYKFPRIDYSVLKQFKGDFVVSTACIGGPLSYDIYSEFPSAAFDERAAKKLMLEARATGKLINVDFLGPHIVDDDVIRERILRKLENTVDRIIDAVGQENFFLELQFNKLSAQHLTNRLLIELSKRTGVQLIATADSHYYNPNVWKEREIYKKLGWLNYSDISPDDVPQSVDELKAELYPKNASQMWEEYKRTSEQYSFYDDQVVCDAIERTHDIAFNLIEDVKPDTSIKLPSYVIPKGKQAHEALEEMCLQGLADLRARRPEVVNDQKYDDRLKYELSVISEKKFSEYFLTMKAIIDIASEKMLIGPGRGSAAGSLVNYALGITQVDPLKYGLIFERFINPLRCLDPSLLVLKKGEIVSLQGVCVGDEIMWHGGLTKVTQKFKSKQNKVCKVLFNEQTILCSLNHRWIVERDNLQIEVEARNLQKNDAVISYNGNLNNNKRKNLFSIVEKIEIIDSEMEMIDLSVDSADHTFFISSNGNDWVSTHNSDLPDIDNDFSDRDLLIQLLKEKFGDLNVLPISNYNTFQLKSLVKDISRFFGIEFAEVNSALSTLDEDVRRKVLKQGDDKNLFELKLEDSLEHSKKFKDFMDEHPEVLGPIQTLLKENRSLGKHAGGVIVSENIVDRMPVIMSKKEVQTPFVEGMHYKHLNELGFVKYDLLGLETLRIIERCIELILQRHKNIAKPSFKDIKEWYDQVLHPDVIDINDKKVFEHVYHSGRWAGIFQFTAKGAQMFCERAKPDNIIDVAAITSIYRPGPLVAGVDRDYVEAKQNPENVHYAHPLIKEVLGETFGFLVFQEQMLRLGHTVGKMPLAKCDRLRKVITKRSMSDKGKAASESEQLGEEFVVGALENGFTQAKADELWDNMAAFRGYAFNKSLHGLQGIIKYSKDGTDLGESSIKDFSSGDFVKSRDETTGKDVFVEVKALHDHGTIELFEFEMDDGRLVRCSMEHKFRTTDGRMLPMKQIVRENLSIVVDIAENNSEDDSQ